MNGKLKFKQRVFALILVSIILSAVFPFGVFAEPINSHGTFSDGTNWIEKFGASETPMLNMIDSAESFISTHGNNVNDFNNIPTLGLTRSNENAWAGYFDDIKDFENFDIYNSANAQNVDYDLTNNTYHVIFANNNGSFTYAQCYYFWTENRHNVYFVGGGQGNYICSDDELHCFYQEIVLGSQTVSNAYTSDYYIEQNQGIYYIPFAAISASSGTTPIGLTDLSVYCSTQSGNSGFTNSGFSGGTADFDFASVSDYYDFNMPKTSGDFIDPNAPDEPEVQDTLARYYLKFNDTTFYGGHSLTNFYHHNDFTFNEYQLQHPEQFKINFVYQIELNRFNSANFTWGFPSFYNYSTSVNLAYMLGQNKRFGTGSHVAIPLSVNYFVDDSGNTNLADVLKTCVTNIDGTNSSIANPNTIIGSVESDIDTIHEVLWGPDTVTSKQLNPVISRYYNSNTNYAIKDFYIKGTVSIVDINDSNYESGTYRDYYNFRDGKGGVLSSSSTDEPYQLPEALNPAPLANNGSGDVSTNNGTVVNNYISGGARGGAELVKVWTPFTLSEVSYANTHGMFQDILEFMDASSENGFLPVVKQVFSFLPETIWTYLTISIAVICGFAVIRFALRK